MTKVAVVHDSSTGTNEATVHAVAEGATSAGAETRVRLVLAWVAAVGLCSSACASYGPGCETPPEMQVCPQPFDVNGWCTSAETCTVSGEPQPQPLETATLLPGQKIAIPIGSFAAELALTHDLVIQLLGGNTSHLASECSAFLDGVPGASSKPRWHPGAVIMRWEPFPSAPHVLEIEVPQDFPAPPSTDRTEIQIWFVDATCWDIAPTPC